MRNVFKVILSAALLLGISAALLPDKASAQDIFGGDSMGGSKRKGPRKPTQITSETLDADMGKNTIVFTGNVFVDDDDMTISCHKLTIFLEEKDQGDAGMKDKKDDKAKAAPTGSDDIKSKKEPVRIVCEEDVVLVRKIYDPVEKSKGEQRATGGKAVYDIKLGQIELTENNPTITRGGEIISADKITIWRDQQRAKFDGNVKTSFASAFESAAPETKPEESTTSGTNQTLQTPQTEVQSSDDQEQPVKRKVYTGRVEKTEDTESAEPENKVDVRNVIATDKPEQK